MYLLIDTVMVPPTSICTQLLLVAKCTVVDVLVVHTWILYYICNNREVTHDPSGFFLKGSACPQKAFK